MFLHQVQRRDSLQIGLIMMPGAMMMALGSPIAGIITDRFGGRWLTFAGTLTMAAAILLYHNLDPSYDMWMVLAPQFMRGVGMALINTPVVTTGVNSVSREDAGNASWLLNLSQRVGGAFSISILSTILKRETTIQKDFLGGSPIANSAPPRQIVRWGKSMGFSALDANSAAKAALGRKVGQAASTLAFQHMFLVLGLIALTASLPAYFLTLFRRPMDPPGEQPAGN